MTDKDMKDQAPAEEVAAADSEAQAAPEQEAAPTLESLQEQNQELNDRMLRMAAELDNFKKRTERDKARFLERANESLLRDLLPVLDALDRAMEHAAAGESGQSMAEGLSLIQQELDKALEKHGLTPIAALGQPFDPELHEAVMQQEDPEQADGTVLTEYQKGYMYRDRLLRPTMVVVSKRPVSSDDDGDPVTVQIH